ncbi:putative pyrophosphatase [Schinkia azotoformans MEV2011]|uniref:Putative pyrophosphatase n=1 Tax=Schinkia azotoformans MEV2011 TaxID=1348973 RepID=A0A072NRU2_SCHAZ|nr:MazG nucleotide pyrophosphohydrolase domain-containing protein [Schinkia azotoformans]KEF40434.1 putative pyrophosphatase [Schinkia azotoformans MEV2011]MEC1696156.1 MazG nucleotide pyrophosphohydrolase domain-containing protein [Schinkia azotoformans]MEC1716628.1 MazG nucleotide pyrophosphohydrolase domain-containing protein [Schinkia azotoformans]MEC1725341.1 MazG nucleotide pyrophosphohydrolase domain-containing protein [Schinkia azotoformans]MEC1739467.1 MazG nucleotide pyrophosphohydro
MEKEINIAIGCVAGSFLESEDKRKVIETLRGFEQTGPSITNLCQQAFETAKSKGWHDEERETGTLLALIHSEVSEALEADRKGNAENFAEELADVCIRVFDLCGAKGVDLESAILNKMKRNKSRTYKHGGKAY